MNTATRMAALVRYPADKKPPPWRAGLRALTLLLVAVSLGHSALAAPSSRDVDESNWKKLRQEHFGDRDIADGKRVVGLDAPYRAEDAAVVPITISDRLAATGADRRIEKLWLIIDNNPEPMSATFEFGPAAKNATIATRVRVNAYTYMRVIAQTDDNKLYMTKSYVKAGGGCSAPVGSDPEKALKHMGEMRLREVRADDGPGYRTQLMIRHPNITGLQMDQLTRLVYPAHYVDAITIMKGGKQVLDSHMTFSLSENPSIQFMVKNDEPGDLSVRVHDNKDNEFTQSWPEQAVRRPVSEQQNTKS